jgi:hypothetical protein
MPEQTRTLDLRPFLVVAAVVVLGLAIWAAGAYGAGGSSSNDPAGGPSAQLVQAEEESQPPAREDCPERRGGRDDPAPEQGSGGSESLDL